MNKIRFSVVVCLVTMFFSLSLFAQDTSSEKKIYRNIIIEKFTLADGVDYPEDKLEFLTRRSYLRFNYDGRFRKVETIGVDVEEKDKNDPTKYTSTDENEGTLKIKGEVVKFQKGSRAKRYIIGLGTGSTKVSVNFEVTDNETNEVILNQVLVGKVWGGLFGGDSSDVKDDLADKIVRLLRQKNLLGEKLKKNK